MSECRRRKSRRLLTILTRLLVGAVATLGLCVTLQSRVQTAAICAGELLCCARSATFLSCGGGGAELHNLLPSIWFLMLTQINKVKDTNKGTSWFCMYVASDLWLFYEITISGGGIKNVGATTFCCFLFLRKY